MGRKRRTIEFVKERVKEMQPNIEIISSEYKTNQSKLDLECKVCDNKWSSSWASLQQGCGCPSCSAKKANKHNKYTIEKIISMVSEIHKNRITILDDEYDGAHCKLNVSCNECGLKWRTDWNHLRNKKGCPSCNKRGWSKSKYLKMAETSLYFDSFKLYKIKCWNNNEEFYKIGITYNTLKERFRKKNSLPYNYEVIEIIESEDGEHIWNLEKELHRQHKEFKYVPKLKFGGMYECFTKLID